MSSFDIAQNVINTQVPYFPSYSWGLTSSDFGVPDLWVFNWIQAFWDVNDFAATPKLVISNGERDANNDLICSLVQFAYSGERVNFKGKIILASGTDRRGNAITSTPINASSPADSFINVIAYGGNY